MILRTYITASLVIACALSSKYLSRKCCMTDMALVIAEALQKDIHMWSQHCGVRLTKHSKCCGVKHTKHNKCSTARRCAMNTRPITER